MSQIRDHVNDILLPNTSPLRAAFTHVIILNQYYRDKGRIGQTADNTDNTSDTDVSVLTFPPT